jgi:hypothetical protein
MITKIGKVLVLINAFISIGLLAWAISIFTNRLGYFDTTQAEATVPGQFTQYTNELKRLNDGSALAQSIYVGSMVSLVKNEQDRSFRSYVLGQLLDEVKKQGRPNAQFREFPRDTYNRAASPEYKGLIDVLQWGGPMGAQFPNRKGLDNSPLEGYGQLLLKMKTMTNEEKDYAEQSEKYLQEALAISKEIYDPATNAGVQPELFKMQNILKNLDDERDFLGDSLDNWEEQLRTLKLRKQQLVTRLAEYQKATEGNGR